MFNFSYLNLYFLFVLFLWGTGTLKAVLFWLYLWQLKEYHIGRFIDHFRTYKGRKAIFNFTLVVKILLVIWLFGAIIFEDWGFLIWGIPAFFLLYSFETYRTLTGLAKGTLLKPVFTKKILLIFGLMVAGMVAFLLYVPAIFGISPLLFDILVPVTVSIVVLLVQPFFVMARNRILQKAKNKIAGFPNLKVIGITGSYGKTSTKEFLATMLSSKFKVLATPQHKNSEIGIAQTILQDLNASHEIFIVEMGSYNKGGIKLLCDIVEPEIGIVTGVNQQHLATFGSLENLLSAEGGRELLASLPNHGLLIVNGDNKYCLDLYKSANVRKQLYALQKNSLNSNIWTEDVTVKKSSISFIARTNEAATVPSAGEQKGEMAHVLVNVLGKQHIQNLLGAILVAKDFGMNFSEISEACKHILQEQAGMTLKTGIHGITIIDSSYSSNPDGVIADLDYLSVFPENPSTGLRARKVIVMPCLIELGQKSIEAHIQIGKKIAETCDLAIITTKDKFKEIKMAAVMNGMSEDKILLCDKPQEILTHITTLCKEGDAVLLEGRVPSEVIKLLKL